MTREEAEEILTHNWTRVDNPNYSESELDEAIDMAIEALSADAKGDLIRRSDIQYHTQLEPMGNGQYSDVEVAYKDDIDALPSAEPEEAVLNKMLKEEMIILPQDYVKVVRCKDCKYRDPEDERCDHGAVNFLLRRMDNDFCSYGERKGGD